ncbi:MAG TPA: pirin family protein [Ignavibacteria bacterium]|nr:pirin family protein [Ignavibacteria bacterium]
MNKIIHKADSRGYADHGWLQSYHSFSFANYHNPEKVRFGLLRVINDDIVAPGMGFGTHPHDNMEIVTIPLKGELAHQDSTGNKEVIRENEVQIMSAGSGLSHSEFNNSKKEDVNLFQIWVFPKVRDIKPRYDQRKFDPEARKNKFQTVVSPDEKDDALWINQDAYFSLGNFDEGITVKYDIRKPGNGAYIMITEGSAEIDGEILSKRDAVGISDASSIDIKLLDKSELLVIEVPMTQ